MDGCRSVVARLDSARLGAARLAVVHQRGLHVARNLMRGERDGVAEDGGGGAVSCVRRTEVAVL